MSGRLFRTSAAPVEVPAIWRSVARSESGPLRQLNEDRLVDFPRSGFWAVADGMGGHSAGDVAAQMVVDSLDAAAAGAPLRADAVEEALQAVNRGLIRSHSSRLGATSGSTVVALLLADGAYTCLWAGDSRAYRFRHGRLEAISRDHSVVQEMVEAGLISPAEARVHPRANVITRAVGVEEPLRLERASGAAEPGDRFLLCSDGLVGAVEEPRIAAFLAGKDLERAADGLMAAALAAPAQDNVTFVLVAEAGGEG